MIKKKHLPVNELNKFIKDLKQLTPEWLHSPSQALIIVMNIFNDTFKVLCYLILIGQSARLLHSDHQYITIKVLLTKWILMIVFQTIFSQIEQNHFQVTFLKSVFLTVLILIIYPSKVSKSIFNQDVNTEEKQTENIKTTESTISEDTSLFQILLISLAVRFLKVAKYMTTFIHPTNRKSIQTQLKAINSVIDQEKYFWKIYDSDSNATQSKEQKKEKTNDINPQMKQSLKQSIAKKQKWQETSIVIDRTSQADINQNQSKILDKKQSILAKDNSTLSRKNSILGAKQSLLSIKDSVIKKKNALTSGKQSKKYRKYSVSQYLPLFTSANRSGFAPSNPATKRCTFYRQIEISYDVDSAVMTVTSLEDMKVSYHNLQEIVLLDDFMVQFEYEDNQHMIVKFKTNADLEEFISAVDVEDSDIRQ